MGAVGIVTAEPDDYQPADRQLHQTTGLEVGPDGPDHVEEAGDGTTRAVLAAINSPKQIDHDEDGVPVSSMGTYRWLPNLDLPGFGEELEDCGDQMPFFCDGCGATRTHGRTCKRSTCPRCAPAWCRDRAISVAARLDATRRMRNHSKDAHQRFHHLAISPPTDWMLEAEDVLDRSFRVIGDILDALDLDGYVFYHPWRGRGGDDRGQWRNRMFSEKEWSDVKGDLTHSPHFHVICVGHHVQGGELTKRVSDETGWIINRITESENSNVSLYDDEAMCRSVTYCISHTGLEDKGESKRVAYRKYGSAINAADVYEDKKRPIDLLVRKTAPKTLGVDLGEQICEKETKPGIFARGTPSAMSLLNDGEDHGDDLEAGPDGDGVEQDASAGSTPDAAGQPDTEHGPELETCEGRLLPLQAAERNADRYLENSQWVRNAEHAEQLQMTLDAWGDELEGQPG